MITNYQNFLKINEDNRYNNVIDFTFLRDDCNREEIEKTCKTAQEMGAYSVCILPEFISDAKIFLEDTPLKVCTVIDFPEGESKPKQKLKATREAIIAGVDEIDLVMNYKKLKNATVNQFEDIYQELVDEIKLVAQECHKNGIVLKVIIESGELTLDQIKTACQICVDGGADYVKTSTGKTIRGAELDKVQYMKKILPDHIKLKAAGGIRTLADVKKFYPHVSRIGTSSTLN
jgi:deoxyribose-phosphate aldolase